MSMIGDNNPSTSPSGLSPEDKKTLRKAILELNDSMTRVGAERDLQKEIITETFDKIGVDKKMIRKIARVYYKANFNEEVESANDFEEFYQEVIQKTAL
jgi:hypothetical protein